MGEEKKLWLIVKRLVVLISLPMINLDKHLSRKTKQGRVGPRLLKIDNLSNLICFYLTDSPTGAQHIL